MDFASSSDDPMPLIITFHNQNSQVPITIERTNYITDKLPRAMVPRVQHYETNFDKNDLPLSIEETVRPVSKEIDVNSNHVRRLK